MLSASVFFAGIVPAMIYPAVHDAAKTGHHTTAPIAMAVSLIESILGECIKMQNRIHIIAALRKALIGTRHPGIWNAQRKRRIIGRIYSAQKTGNPRIRMGVMIALATQAAESFTAGAKPIRCRTIGSSNATIHSAKTPAQEAAAIAIIVRLFIVSPNVAVHARPTSRPIESECD